ncbi:MAG: OmpA family protein [Schleiferiaceae bacterium]
MMNAIKSPWIAMALSGVMLSGCVSKSKFTELEQRNNEVESELSQARLELAKCISEKEAKAEELQNLRESNASLLNSVGNLSLMSSKDAENLERSLESIRQKDLTIKSLQDAVTRKDSVTLALVTSLKGELGDMSDEDVSINVEKGVVYISISDRLLFKSGSSKVTSEAKSVLGKVADILQNKPELEIMVEGHTDTDPIAAPNIEDNWDLSVKRATSIVRILQNEYNVAPERMTAAGRGEYLPIASNDSAEGKAANRRTKIIVLPDLDQFYGMIEEGMEKQQK